MLVTGGEGGETGVRPARVGAWLRCGAMVEGLSWVVRGAAGAVQAYAALLVRAVRAVGHVIAFMLARNAGAIRAEEALGCPVTELAREEFVPPGPLLLRVCVRIVGVAIEVSCIGPIAIRAAIQKVAVRGPVLQNSCRM